MRRTRTTILVGVVAALSFAACSSDDAPDTTGGTSDTATDSTGTDGSTAESSSTSSTTAAGSTTSAVEATSTTVAGRVVTDPADNVTSGDTGEGVKQIQYTLVANGYEIPIDGEFGPVTETAVRDYQKKNGLTVDGVVGPVTWSAMQASIGITTTSGAAGEPATTVAATTTTTTG